ncbi:MAG TPA: hypothetical protein VKH42_21510 [Vicinamibacterales bacterium]|nr:hypothetical protein [Vicinamibacterales bacterium]
MGDALIVAGTAGSYALAWLIGKPLLVPILNTIASYPWMVAALKRGDVRTAIRRMLVWAATMGVCATAMSYTRPLSTNRLFLRGADYRNEMFEWVRTGHGAESTPSVFIPAQARDAAIFSAAAIATGGALAMPMGAVLMNQMGHYVGALAAWSAHPAATMIVGWHPWAVIRVASFVVIGVVLSIPLLSRVFGSAADVTAAARRYLPWAAGGLIVDVMLKSLLAPSWQRLLLWIVGW